MSRSRNYYPDEVWTSSVMQYRGDVVLKKVDIGSKSERDAVFLANIKNSRYLDNRDIEMRRPGGSPFHDDILRQLVGHKIECSGDVYGYNGNFLFISNWNILG
jgi:hypothetical protein